MEKPYALTVLDSYILIEPKENLNGRELAALWAELNAMPEYRTHNGLWDFRYYNPDIQYSELVTLADYIARTYEPGEEKKRTALVVGGDLGYGLARTYDALTEHIPTEVRIFKDIDEARGWLTNHSELTE